MPPKGSSNKKRTRSPDSPAESPTSTGSGRTVQATIGNRVQGKLQRSPETLAALAVKKSEKEIWDGIVPFARNTKDSDFDASTMWRFATWNVAGLRGLLKKSPSAITDLLVSQQLDVLCLQETKLNVGDANNEKLGAVDGYTFLDHPCAVKKGYSGTRTYVKKSLQADSRRGHDLIQKNTLPPADAEGDAEGRVLSTFLTTSPQLGGPNVAIVNTYVPNSGMTLDRLPYRVETFDAEFRKYLQSIDAMCVKNWQASPKQGAADPFAGFIWTGDLNVSERDYDRYYAGTFKTMQEISGFTPEERKSLRQTLAETNAVDTFRHLYPNMGPVYTYFSARINGRTQNKGWRLDYFVVANRLVPYVVDCYAMPEVLGSDHCPVQMWLRKP